VVFGFCGRLETFSVLVYNISDLFFSMQCPICRHADTKVADSRVMSDGFSVRRRRECEKCNYRFSTIEELELLDIVVVKNDGRREAYLQSKVRQGIIRSLAKRPYTQEKFEAVIHAIERDIQKKRKREVRSSEIGEIIMKHLAKFDKIAYIRFASIYRDFEDVGKFHSVLKTLEKSDADKIKNNK